MTPFIAIDTALRFLSASLPVGSPPGHATLDDDRCIVEARDLRLVLDEVDRLRAQLAAADTLAAAAERAHLCRQESGCQNRAVAFLAALAAYREAT